jgi:hypothetical protein
MSNPAAGTFEVITASIDAVGWTATYVNTPPTFTPDTNPVTFAGARQGYDGTGTPATIVDQFTFTQRTRQPFPSQASLTPTTVALSDYIYSTDDLYGFPNNSSEISPLPICNWVMPSRLTVSNTINLELVAFHRNARKGRQVACVIFSATDGTTTVTQTVSTPTVSARGGDANPVIVYAAAINITSLSTISLITCNAKVYPWIGAAASVADSSTTTVVSGSTLRAFTPRYFYKDTAGQASPWYAYVVSTGNDATGVASQTAGTAKAASFLTVKAAMKAINTAAGQVDNGIIRLTDSVSLGNTFFGNFTQKCGSPVITRDPAVSRATAVAKLDVGFDPPIVTGFLGAVNVGSIYFTDLTILRSGTTQLQGTINYYFDKVTFDNASGNAAWMNGTSNDYYFATTFLNVATFAGLASSTGEHRCFRGCSGTLGGNAIEGWLQVGNIWTTCGGLDQFGSSSTPPTRTATGMILFNNSYLMMTSGLAFLYVGQKENITGATFVQNLFEWCSATTQFCFRPSADSADLGNIVHMVVHNNTFIGFANCGRGNILYDTTLTNPRFPKLNSFVGNIHVQINNKSDLFLTNGAFVGNWNYYYGAGCKDEFSQYQNASGGAASFMQTYPGLGANIGTSSTVRNDPLFANYQGTTSGPTAGSGGGTYTVASNSPCKSMVVSAVLPFDLSGTARNVTGDTAGAYA